MRSAFKTLLVLTSIAVAFAHSEQALPRRKSLGFGPTLPHATFTTSPPAHLTISSSFASSDPFDVARSFLNNLLSDLDSEHTNYVIREDSYTDTRNGVTHVYANQYVNGLEVTDGRININIKDGKVLSYGDSVSGNLLRVSHTRNLSSRFFLIVLPRFSSISWQYRNTIYPRAFLRHFEWQDWFSLGRLHFPLSTSPTRPSGFNTPPRRTPITPGYPQHRLPFLKAWHVHPCTGSSGPCRCCVDVHDSRNPIYDVGWWYAFPFRWISFQSHGSTIASPYI